MSDGDNRNQMSPESIKVTLSTSAGFPADYSRPSNSQTHIPSNNNNNNINPPNYRNPPIHYQRSSDYQDTTNQKLHYDSEHSPTISLKTGFRYNNPYANNNNNDHFAATKNAKQNYTVATHQHTNDAPRHETKNRDSVATRQKILDFIISDTQPKSFQSPSRTPLSANDIKFVNNAFVNTNHESSSIIISTPSSIINTTSFKAPKTTSHPSGVTDIGSLQLSAANDDSIRFVLGARNSQNRSRINNNNNNNSETSESQPLYSRQEAQAQSTTTTATAPRPREEIVVPTTYAPLKNWKLQYVKRPAAAVTTLPLNTIANSHSDDKKHSSQFDEITFTTPVGPVISKFPTSDYNRPISPSAGTRQQSFREILNKTYETSTPSKYHVSPYTSLKSLLSDEPTKLSFRPTSAPSSTPSPAPPSSNPFRNYFLITAPPKKFTSDSTTHSPTNFFTNHDQTTTTPISITSSASTPVASSNYDWTPINYNYNGKIPSNDGGRFKPTENSIDLDGVDMTTSYPIRASFSSTYYPRPTTPSTTTPPSITTARILLASTSERDHYRKVVRMRSKKKLHPSNVQTNTDEAGEIIHGHPYGKLSEPIVITSGEHKNTYHHSNKYPTYEVPSNIETSSENAGLPSNLPTKYYSNYRHVKDEQTLADYIRNQGPEPEVVYETERPQEPIVSSTGSGQQDGYSQRQKFRATVEMPEFNIPTESEIKAKLKQLEVNAERDIESEEHYETTTAISRHDIVVATTQPQQSDDRTKDNSDNRRMTQMPVGHGLAPQSTTTRINYSNMTQTTTTQRTINSIHTIPPRASRVNAAIKTTIAAASLPTTRRSNTATTTSIRFATLPLLKCTDSTPNAKCNEIPSRYTLTRKYKPKSINQSHPIAPYIEFTKKSKSKIIKKKNTKMPIFLLPGFERVYQLHSMQNTIYLIYRNSLLSHSLCLNLFGITYIQTPFASLEWNVCVCLCATHF